MKRIISTLLIIVGILLIFSPFFSKMIVKSRVKNTQDVIEEVTFEEIEENEKDEEGKETIYDFSAIKDVSIVSSITGNINFDNKNVIGQIAINDIDINLPVLKGLTNSNLMAGAATMVGGLKMGEGNYSLAGHYMKDSLLFGNLLDIQIGSLIKITDKKTIYEYTVYDIQVVDDTAFYMLDQNRAKKRGKPIISLMTCYYTSKNGKRFFALGELTNEYPYETGALN